jgi:hypothetical protein
MLGLIVFPKILLKVLETSFGQPFERVYLKNAKEDYFLVACANRTLWGLANKFCFIETERSEELFYNKVGHSPNFSILGVHLKVFYFKGHPVRWEGILKKHVVVIWPIDVVC